jgi:hypothetical protein
MATIDLKIVADSNQAVSEITKVTEASKTMQRTVQEGEKRQKGLIEDTIDALKKYEIARNKAMSVEGIEKYNKKIAEGRQTLKEYETAGVQANEKVEKSGNSLLQSIGRWALGFATITAAIKIFKSIMGSTQISADFLAREIKGLTSALGELWRSIATGNITDLGKRMNEVRNAGREYADALDYIGDRGRELMLREGERKIQLAELAKVYRNTALSHEKQAEAAQEFIRLTEEGAKEAVELAELRLKAELKLASSMTASAGEMGRLTEEEIKNNLKRAEYLRNNEEAVNNYRVAVANLTAEEAKRAQTSVSPEGVLMPAAGGPDPNLIKLYKEQIAGTSDEIKQLSEEMKGWNLVTDEQRANIVSAINEISNKRAEAISSTIRANIKAEMANKDVVTSELKDEKERLKNLEDFIKATVDLQDEYDKSQIDKLEGTERFAAERDYQLKQIAALKKHLESLGTLTEDHYKWIASLEKNANLEYLKKSADYDQKAYDEMVKHGDNVRELDRQLQEEALDLITDNEEEKLKLKIKFAEEDIKLLEAIGDIYSQSEIAILKQRIAIWNKEIEKSKEDATPIWDALGITDKEDQDKAQESLDIMVSSVVSALDEIYAKRIEDAQRRRELLETEIDDTQNALNAEIELAKLGFANNVDAKRAQLAELEKQRTEAIKKEEKALEAQRKIESASQAMSLISTAANLLKGWSEIPFVGQVLAIAAIAAMFAAFAATKIQARAAAKLAKGGYGDETGVITGRLHREGGERFLDHVEVERGEMFGVLSRSASAKHGKEFAQIVTSFNKDNLIIERQDAPNNYINVDVNQTNSRLDKVENQLIKLNHHFAGQKEVHETADMRIEKIGNKTRIIRK